MEVYIAQLLYSTAVLSVLVLRTFKTSSQRSHFTSPRIKLAAIIRGLISSTLNPCSKRLYIELVVGRNITAGKQAVGCGFDLAGFLI